LNYLADGNKNSGLLNRLKICPHLFTIHSVQANQTSLIASTTESCKCHDYYNHDDQNQSVRIGVTTSSNIPAAADATQSTDTTTGHTLPVPTSAATTKSPLTTPAITAPSNEATIPRSLSPLPLPTTATSDIDSTQNVMTDISIGDASQPSSANNHNNQVLSVQIPAPITTTTTISASGSTAGSARYVTTLKNQIDDLHDQVHILRDELEHERRTSRQWKLKWSQERNNCMRLWDRLEALQNWLRQGFYAIPTPASNSYSLPPRKTSPMNNIAQHELPQIKNEANALTSNHDATNNHVNVGNSSNVDMIEDNVNTNTSTSPTSTSQVEHVKNMITAPIRESAEARTVPLNIPKSPLDNSSELPSIRNPLTANVVNPVEIERRNTSIAEALPVNEAMRSRQATPLPLAASATLHNTAAAMAIES
jgi:hypothetical protein